MRRFAVLVGLGSIVLAAGCLPGLRPKPDPAPSPAVTTKVPSAPELIQYMNNNAALVQSVKSTEVDMVAKQGGESVGLSGQLFCEKPRNFRLRAVVAGQPAVDIGSNDNEFWFWISQAKDDDGVARVHYCSYQDMAAGKARMPFPFQLDMIVAALGLGEYSTDETKYTVKSDDKTISLVEQTTSAQGQAVQKVTVFNRTRVQSGKPQVIAYLLLDDKGAEICRASVEDVQIVPVDRDQRAVLPQRVALVWKTQKIELQMKLSRAQANNITQQQAARLFSRADLGYPTANLAQGADTPKGYSEMSIQRTQLLAPVK
ncbi:MAG TPA: hypothetical protein VMS17_08265 [Gemmataceae bacterium]|nr:hypothetical protein [Gemmataceae bacterium]